MPRMLLRLTIGVKTLPLKKANPLQQHLQVPARLAVLRLRSARPNSLIPLPHTIRPGSITLGEVTCCDSLLNPGWVLASRFAGN